MPLEFLILSAFPIFYFFLSFLAEDENSRTTELFKKEETGEKGVMVIHFQRLAVLPKF